jgi:hypothetical protein
VISAVAAIMSDLEHLGLLDDAEVLGRDEDGTRAVCPGCQMRRFGYTGLADRFEFAISVTGRGEA